MATVTNNLTRIHDAEGSLTTGNIPSGGAAAAANTDIFLQGSQSLGKRITVTATTEGFALVDGADNDCSAAGVHVGMWIWITHYSIMDDLRVALCTGTTPASNYKYWTVPLTEIPALGGWKRVWVENGVGGTTGAGTYTTSQTRCYGAMVSFSATPGGNAANLIVDSADYTDGAAALSLTGTSGLWTDFTTSDENSSNQYGVFRKVGGVYNCFARVKLGTSSSLVFNDSNFVIIFPQQSLVADSFMGITIDLQHASTNIDWANASISSSGSKQGDLVVSGTSGTFDAVNVTMAGIRIITLTSACSLSGCLISNSGLITLAGADITNSTIVNSTGSVAVLAASPAGAAAVTNTTFTSDGTGHGMEIGGTAANITFTNLTWSGYASSDGSTGNEAVFVNIGGGSMNLTISGGTTPSIKTAGCAVTVISGAVSATVTVKTVGGTAIQYARVLVVAAAGGPMPFNVTVTISNSGTTATVTHSAHGMATNDKVQIKGASHLQNNGVFTITKIDAGSYSYTMGSAPGSSPSGTIKCHYVALSGETDANGEITMSRVFSSDQPITGRVRKSTGSPIYKTANIVGTIDSVAGFAVTTQLIGDE